MSQTKDEWRVRASGVPASQAATGHADYPSGYCAIGGAATELLRMFFKADRMNASYTDPPLGVTRRWRSFSQMGEEVGNARVWGGIHTRTADEHAHVAGEKVAEFAFTNFLEPVPSK